MMDTLNIVLDLVLVVLNLTVIVLLLKKKGECTHGKDEAHITVVSHK